ncbi:MAG: hypothetical protein ABII18_03130 [bacterium]|nr:hypothetical protein [bacterium]MBU1918044.1 hypothetical protein [bacterium]
MLKRLRNNKGFSLIESALTTVILSTALITSLFVIQGMLIGSVDQELNTIATQLANEKIEIILADKEFQGYDYITDDSYENETLTEYSNLSRTVTITEVNEDDLKTPEEDSGSKKVEVTVSWGNEAYQQVTISTLITDMS